MRKLKTLVSAFFFFGSFSVLHAINGFGMYGEFGIDGFLLKSKELPVFLTAYNSSNLSSLIKPFDMKLKMARGPFFHIGAVLGPVEMGLGGFYGKTPDDVANFKDGTARNISVSYRAFNYELAGKFGNGPVFFQIQGNIGLQDTYIRSSYQYADGTRSFGKDHSLNGVYNEFGFLVGGGAAIGVRIVKDAYICFRADYMTTLNKQHPEYHTFSDKAHYKAYDGIDYLPRDMSNYNNYSGSTNSISNDFKGIRFGLSLKIMIVNHED